jgi:DNA polymerase (family 10)
MPRRNVTNKNLAQIFSEMAAILEIKGVDFKPKAFEKAAVSLENLAEEVEEIYRRGGLPDLEEIPGVGQGLAERIEEFIKTGKIGEYQKLKREFPVAVGEMMKIEGVGPKIIEKVYEELDIKNVAELKQAAEQGKLRNIAGLGEKLETKILRAINFLETEHGRFLLGEILPISRVILEKIKRAPGVEKIECAGSLKRMQETVGDLDFLVVSREAEAVMDFFTKLPEVESVIAKGRTKSSVRLKIGIDADLRVIEAKSFGAALQYFIGDKYHNVAVREIAAKRGYKLNEYGLFKGKKTVAAKDENEIYLALGMAAPPPEIRTNHGEIEAALSKNLPNLIDYDDLQGDLQIQTDWSDGENSILEMAKAARAQGLNYILITDHSHRLTVANGLDEKRLLKQAEEIDKVNGQFSGFKVLKGIEVDILKDGSLDLSDNALEKLDIVGASIHSHFEMDERSMTERIIRAMENPHVDIIFHPTGRLIQKRPAYKVDIDRIIKTANKTGTVLEINAFPERLDLRDEYIRKAVTVGVKLCIDSDAHSVEHLKFLELGIGQARRGWAEKKDVANAHDLKKLSRFFK